MSLKSQITEDMKAAMRAGDKDRLKIVRLMLAAIKQVEVDTRTELDDAAADALGTVAGGSRGGSTAGSIRTFFRSDSSTRWARCSAMRSSARPIRSDSAGSERIALSIRFRHASV